MDPIKGKSNDPEDNESSDTSHVAQPSSPTKTERQSSYCRKETEEHDDMASCLQEEESGKEKSFRMREMQQVIEETQSSANDIQNSKTEEDDGGCLKDQTKNSNRLDVTEEDGIRNLSTEDDTEAVAEGHHVGPSADIMGSKTVDDDVRNDEKAREDFRASATVEETASASQNSHRPRNTRVIWKLSEVREHPKNEGPKSKMIASLPSETIIRDLEEWILIGRGQPVDVFLEDMLSSRFHGNFRVRRDNRSRTSCRFVVELKNISKSKFITINRTRDITTDNIYELLNNDEVSIGVFTFRIEIAPGESSSSQYEMVFRYNASTPTSVAISAGDGAQVSLRNSPYDQESQRPESMQRFPYYNDMPPLNMLGMHNVVHSGMYGMPFVPDGMNPGPYLLSGTGIHGMQAGIHGMHPAMQGVHASVQGVQNGMPRGIHGGMQFFQGGHYSRGQGVVPGMEGFRQGPSGGLSSMQHGAQGMQSGMQGMQNDMQVVQGGIRGMHDSMQGMQGAMANMQGTPGLQPYNYHQYNAPRDNTHQRLPQENDESSGYWDQLHYCTPAGPKSPP